MGCGRGSRVRRRRRVAMTAGRSHSGRRRGGAASRRRCHSATRRCCCCSSSSLLIPIFVADLRPPSLRHASASVRRSLHSHGAGAADAHLGERIEGRHRATPSVGDDRRSAIVVRCDRMEFVRSFVGPSLPSVCERQRVGRGRTGRSLFSRSVRSPAARSRPKGPTVPIHGRAWTAQTMSKTATQTHQQNQSIQSISVLAVRVPQHFPSHRHKSKPNASQISKRLSLPKTQKRNGCFLCSCSRDQPLP